MYTYTYMYIYIHIYIYMYHLVYLINDFPMARENRTFVRLPSEAGPMPPRHGWQRRRKRSQLPPLVARASSIKTSE